MIRSMTPDQFKETNPLLDTIADQLGEWIDSDASAEIRRALAQLSEQQAFAIHPT